MHNRKAEWPSWSPTRYKYLGVTRTGTIWRFVCLEWEGGGTKPDAPAVIGPQYRTKAECLADLHRYASDSYPELA